MTSPSCRVLLVDDDPDMRGLLHVALEASGRCEVVGESPNAEIGIEKATALQPDVIVLDHMMPGMTGLDAAPLLRHAVEHVRIVLFSAVADRLERTAVVDIDAYVRKGERLSDTVDIILG